MATIQVEDIGARLCTRIVGPTLVLMEKNFFYWTIMQFQKEQDK